MKKYFIFAAFAGLALASCTDDDFVGNMSPPAEEEALAPISFSSSQNAFTRADLVGAEAAQKLNYKFVVTGFKGDETKTVGSIVFDNYLVEYTENTAHKTESNSSNWEYVGKGLIPHAVTNGITQQATKYWDYTVAQYDFFAWSTGEKPAVYKDADLADGKVLVSNITPNSKQDAPAWATNREAYSFKGKAEDLSQCYISDIVTVKKTTAGTYGEVAGYNQTVKLRFRQLGTKVRIGIYETVPGYSVKDVRFYSAAAVDTVKAGDAKPTSGTYTQAEAEALNKQAKIFTTVENDIYKEGTYTVYFPTVDTPADADNNQAHIKFEGSGTQKTTVEWDNLNYTIRESGERSDKAIYLGRSSNAASYAGEPNDNYYVVYLPNQSGTNLNLRVNYTLESIDGSGETITVKGATAQVPSIYTAWKPGFAYTYLFKISDETNGYTGVYDPTQPDNTTVNSDPAGLYPITFDALVVNAEDGDNTQETITTVSTPSITTYQNGSNVVNNNEYTVLTADDTKKITGEIYVTVNDGTTDNTPDLANSTLQDLTGKAALYTIPAGKTEAEVVDALQLREDNVPDGVAILGRNGIELRTATLTLTNEVTYGADGNKIDLTDGEKKKAAKFVPTANTTYAFVYTKTAGTTETNKYQAKSFTAGTSVKGYYRYKLVAATADKDVQKGVTYFSSSDASTAAKTVFIGQEVSNVYTRSGASEPYTYNIASGYAQTGTTYYYTTDGGQTYKEAYTVPRASFATTLYVWDPTANSGAGDYVNTTDTTPQDGTAYYYKDGENYKYCVIYPERTNGLFVFNGTETVDANIVVCGDSDNAVDGMVYFDKYIQNNGVYYTKVIKVAP